MRQIFTVTDAKQSRRPATINYCFYGANNFYDSNYLRTGPNFFCWYKTTTSHLFPVSIRLDVNQNTLISFVDIQSPEVAMYNKLILLLLVIMVGSLSARRNERSEYKYEKALRMENYNRNRQHDSYPGFHKQFQLQNHLEDTTSARRNSVIVEEKSKFFIFCILHRKMKRYNYQLYVCIHVCHYGRTPTLAPRGRYTRTN